MEVAIGLAFEGGRIAAGAVDLDVLAAGDAARQRRVHVYPHPLPAAANLFLQRVSRTGSGENLPSQEFSWKILRTKNLPPRGQEVASWNLLFYFYDSEWKWYSGQWRRKNVRRNGNGLPEQPSLFERRAALAVFFDLSF
ncbi:MAG: hypothetical protein ACM3PW_08040 [Chlamydiota bacterium]